MIVDKSTKYGKIDISLQAISSAAANAAEQCYGVVGMATNQSFNDIENYFRKNNVIQGVVVRRNNKASSYEIDIFIIVAYGVRITEVVTEVQKKVKYDLEQKFNIKFKAINVYVQGIKNIQDRRFFT